MADIVLLTTKKNKKGGMKRRLSRVEELCLYDDREMPRACSPRHHSTDGSCLISWCLCNSVLRERSMGVVWLLAIIFENRGNGFIEKKLARHHELSNST